VRQHGRSDDHVAAVVEGNGDSRSPHQENPLTKRPRCCSYFPQREPGRKSLSAANNPEDWQLLAKPPQQQAAEQQGNPAQYEIQVHDLRLHFVSNANKLTFSHFRMMGTAVG
jgi:hypothetical protein